MDIPERSKQKWILDCSGSGEYYTQARNDKRPGTGTRHTSARGQQQLLEGLSNRSQPAEVKKSAELPAQLVKHILKQQGHLWTSPGMQGLVRQKFSDHWKREYF